MQFIMVNCSQPAQPDVTGCCVAYVIALLQEAGLRSDFQGPIMGDILHY